MKISIETIKSMVTNWLELSKDNRNNTCPFFNKSGEKCLICEKMFPKIVDKKTNKRVVLSIYDLKACPCNIYTHDHVCRKAKAFDYEKIENILRYIM